MRQWPMLKAVAATPLIRPLLDVSGRVGRYLVDAVLPPRCLKCGILIDAPESLCPACWAGLRFLAAPQCACCGYPFEMAAEAGALCAACMAVRPPYRKARAAWAYDDGCRDLILAFKHADRLDLAKPFARWMAQADAELLSEADLITPVPLHWQRLLSRRYNQAALLAQALARLGDRPLAPDLLRRRKATQKQGHLSRLGRRRNVQGAFELTRQGRQLVAGKRVLLVDDVVTTGATIEGCCRILLSAGAVSVDILALARVVRPR